MFVMDYSTYYLLVALLGLITGSFLTALVSRYGAKTMVRGRSACATCGTTLTFRDLIPVISFVVQRGRCRHCDTNISYSYLLTEVVTVILFLLIFHNIVEVYGLSQASIFLFVLIAIVFSTLLAISLYDLEHFIIPDGMVVVFVVAGYIASFYEVISTGGTVTLWHIFAGPIVALPFFFLWLVSKGRWIGFGDIKLAIGIGGLLGIVQGFSALVLGVWAGAIISLFIMGFTHVSFTFRKSKKRLTMKSEVPFGPYLALGTLLSYLFFPDVLNLSLLFAI